MSRALIFVNGRIPDLELVRRLIRTGDTILAADGGTRLVLSLGLAPSVIIGDLDSLTDNDRRELDMAGTEIQRYPRDKNETDFELALHYTAEAGYREILIVAALGNRLDQTLGNLALLTDPSLAGLDVRVDDGVEQAYFVRTQTQVEGRPCDLVSLIPWGGEVTGVATVGLRWPLRGETLYPYQTRGISNEILGETASVSLKSGLLLVVHSRFRQS
ncbi:MAG: thiamine diphosphokinase [Chloroflexi bacterium]|nr:thiamine diphosphokinase [Chloroflexota bacterium]